MTPNSQNISELSDHLGYWLRFVSNHVSQAFKTKVQSQGVTVAEWVLLRALFRAGTVNPSQLAEALGMTRGAISKLVERLVKKKLLERSYPSADRRYQSIELTVAGRELVPRLAQLADENDQEFFGHLSPERRAATIALLEELVQRKKWKDVPLS